MSLTPSSNSLPKSYRLSDYGEIAPLSTSQQALSGVTDPAWPEPLRSPDPSIHIGADHPGWERLIRSPLAIHERVVLITTIFSDRDEVGMLRHLCRDDAQAFIDVIYETLDDLDHTLRMRCLRLVCKICGDHYLLPQSLAIPLSCDRTKDPLCCGGFTDVWKGTSRGLEVAVKVLKSYQRSQEQIRRRFCKEVVMWSALRHPNVLPLLGATMTGTQFVMVSEWMVNGNINEFVEAYPDADRFELLKDVGRGLEYLHGQEMIHGDLKGANILIHRDGHACIADFGLLAVIPDQASFVSTIIHSGGGTLRWMSPELLDPEAFGLKISCPTKESDCYALGMVIYEVLSGRPPFTQYEGTVVILKVMGGERPERPRGTQAEWFTDDLWGMLELCWKQPHDRPNLKAMLECLEGVTPSRPPPTIDEDAVADTGDSLDLTVTDHGEAELLGSEGEGVTPPSRPPPTIDEDAVTDTGDSLDLTVTDHGEAEFLGLGGNPSLPSLNVNRTMITCGLLEETIGAGTYGRLDTTAGDSCLRLTSNHPCGTTGPTITYCGCGFTVPPQSSHCNTTMMVPSTNGPVGEEDHKGGFCNCVIM